MSPIVRCAVKSPQRIKDTESCKKTLALIEEATESPEIAQFTVALATQSFLRRSESYDDRNSTHANHTDNREYMIALLPTDGHTSKGLIQPFRIQFDSYLFEMV